MGPAESTGRRRHYSSVIVPLNSDSGQLRRLSKFIQSWDAILRQQPRRFAKSIRDRQDTFLFEISDGD
jgi:hypothetical protein